MYRNTEPVQARHGRRPNRLYLALALLCALLCAGAASAENFTIETVDGFKFRVVGTSPDTPNITIQVGDSITFENSQGGSHNVAWDSPNGLIRCARGCDDQGGDGNPSATNWEFTRTFNTPGVIDYFCEPHEPLDMKGRITVVGSAQSTGAVSFSSSTYSEPENGGNAVITLNRSGGSDGAASVRVRTSAGTATGGVDYTGIDEIVSWSDGDQADKTVQVAIIDDTAVEPNETVNLSLSDAEGASLGSPSTAVLTIVDNDANSAGQLRFGVAAYDINEGDGNLTARVVRVGGSDGAVSVQYRSAAGTAVGTEDYVITTGTLDWADGDSAAKTFDVQLIDDGEVEGLEVFELVLDNPSGGATLGANRTAEVRLADNDFDDCEPNDTTLCLLDERFGVRVHYEAPQGETGYGLATELTPDSGYFTFFDPNNVEVLVKTINACGPFDRFWVFSAGLTDIAVRIEVTDTQTGALKTYDSPQGEPFEPQLDSSAFATCP